MAKRVRNGSVYVYVPVLLDMTDGRTGLKPGDKVKVITVPGCPATGVMGHCYVGTVPDGKFIGMVCCNSLQSQKDAPEALRLWKEIYEKPANA